jgi:hypothetical protein
MELSRIAELARQDAGRKFHSIAHRLTKEALWEAFDNLRKDAAAGVDEVTYADYEEHLRECPQAAREAEEQDLSRAAAAADLHRQGGWAKEADLDPLP